MDINCPYCNADLRICHDDGFGYEENTAHEMECYECDKTFVFYTQISFDYKAFKADCLNGSDHKWTLVHTAPKEFSTMRCEDCDKRRELTEYERTQFLIRTKESYFKSLKSSYTK